MSECVYTYRYIHMCVYMYIVHIYLSLCVGNVCIHMYVCIYICVCVCTVVPTPVLCVENRPGLGLCSKGRFSTLGLNTEYYSLRTGQLQTNGILRQGRRI